MTFQVDKIFKEYSKQKAHYKNMPFTELAPHLEKALETDMKEVLNIFGISAHAKTNTKNIVYKSIIVFKEIYWKSWLTDGSTNFHAFFRKIAKDLLNENIDVVRFNISITITKTKSVSIVNNYHEFEFQFKYFGNKASINN